MTAPNELNSAYAEGYAAGLADGELLKPLNQRPPILKALVSPRYIDEFSRGYRQGHRDGSARTRRRELRSQQERKRDRKTEGRADGR